MDTNVIKEYDLSKDELKAFLDWYDSRSKGIAVAYYTFVDKTNKGPFTSRKDSIPYDKIDSFKVSEYQAN